jgi:hypothetical protein
MDDLGRQGRELLSAPLRRAARSTTTGRRAHRTAGTEHGHADRADRGAQEEKVPCLFV